MTNKNYLSPYLRLAKDQTINAPWVIHERVIFDYEILLLKQGELLVTVENTTYTGRPGDIFFFRPGQPHSIRSIGSGPVRQPHVHFDFFYEENSPDVKISFMNRDKMSPNELALIRRDDSEIFGINIPSKIVLRNTDHFEIMLSNLINEYKSKLPFYEIKTKSLLLGLITYLIRELYWETNTDTFSILDNLKDIKMFLDDNSNRVVTLEELEKRFNLSKYHLVKIFKKAFSYSPIQYHQIIRIQKAKEMIQYSNKSLTQIAEELDFTSINAFSRAFKNTDGVYPSYYRRNS